MSARELYYRKMFCKSKQKPLNEHKSVLLIMGEGQEDIDACFSISSGRLVLNINAYARILGSPEELKIPQWIDMLES